MTKILYHPIPALLSAGIRPLTVDHFLSVSSDNENFSDLFELK
jgi:hypothetical protein